MIAGAARPSLVIAAVAGALIFFVLAFIVLNRSFAVVSAAIGRAPERRVLTVLSTAVVVVFMAQQLWARAPKLATFPTPVTQTYARQVQFVVSAMHGAHSLPASPSFDANLSRVAGADVLLFFIESYGAVVFERPQFSSQVAEARDGARSGHSRKRIRGRVGTGRIANLRRIVVVRAFDLAVRDRRPRSRHERAADDGAPRHDPDRIRASRLSNGRDDAWALVSVAGGRVLRLHRHLQRRATELPRTVVRLVEHDRPVRAGGTRRARTAPAGAAAIVRVLPDDQHAHPVRTDAAVSARLGAHAHAEAVRCGGTGRRVFHLSGLAESRTELSRRRLVLVSQRWPAT